jgi:hypothetical protein
MNDYYTYRLEHGLTPAEQRAADQRIGEVAKALGDFRRALALSLGRRLGALTSRATRDRAGRTRPEPRSTPVSAGH